MRPHGQTKLGFFPLPVAEAKRLKTWLTFPERFSALDPCVGDGVAFAHLLREVTAHRYGIEIDANRAEQAKALGIETLHANAIDVRCQPEAVSLLYLNPPYDWESGESNNQRLELVFLEHCYRWLKAGGVLLFVVPQLRLSKCARLLSEHFTDLRVFRLTESACLSFFNWKAPSEKQGKIDSITASVPLSRQVLKHPIHSSCDSVMVKELPLKYFTIQEELRLISCPYSGQLSTQPRKKDPIVVELGDRFLPGVVHTSIGSAHDPARRAGVNTKDLTVSKSGLVAHGDVTTSTSPFWSVTSTRTSFSRRSKNKPTTASPIRRPFIQSCGIPSGR